MVLLAKAQLPLDPAVLRVTLPLPLQPPLELNPALGNSLTVTVAGVLTVKAVVVTPPVGMTRVKVPIPPPALKVKLPPPPLVCLDTVRLATAWLVKDRKSEERRVGKACGSPRWPYR